MPQADDDPITPNPLTASDLDITINHEPRIHDLRLAEALGFKKPRDIRPLIERHADALERLGKVCRTVRQTSSRGGRPSAEFWLTKKQAIYIATKAETERATEITIQIVEVFEEVTGGKPPPPTQAPPALPASPPAPPFCNGCAAKQLWALGGFNRTRHPLRDHPIDLTDLEILRTIRERIEAEVKGQLATRLDRAMAAALKTLTGFDDTAPSSASHTTDTGL